MDAFDLAGLFAGRSLPALFDEGPVYVPGLMPQVEQERVVAALHALASDRLLARVDAVLVRDTLEPTRRHLQHLADASQTKAVVVVGWAPDASSDVAWIERDLLLKQFRRMVVVVPYPGQVPRLGAWGELLRATREALQTRYLALCERSGLDDGVWRSLRPLLPRLSNPLNLLLCANTVFEAQLEGATEAHPRERALARLIRKELSWRHLDEVMALLALHLGGEARLAALFESTPERAAMIARLEAQRLWRDGQLQDWAIALAEPDVLRGALTKESDGATSILRRHGWRPGFDEVLTLLGAPLPNRAGTSPDDANHAELQEPQEPTTQDSDPLGRVSDFDFVESNASVASTPTGVDPNRYYFSVPFRAKGDAVIGRADALKKVREQLEKGRPTSIGQAASFVGLGGLGKTQLAVEYAHTYRDHYPRGVFWITADENLDKQLARLACDARWVSPDLEPRYQLDIAIHQVRTRSDCLIIFDNVDTLEALTRILPSPSARPHLLLTSRLPQPGFEAVPLDRLDEAQALEMLVSESRRGFERDDDRVAAQRIARQLEGLPLALELVGAYLRRYPGVRWHDYADQIEAEGIKARALRGSLGHDSFTGHHAGLQATLRISEHVLDRTPRLRDVLDFLAWSGDAAMGRTLLAAALGNDSPDLGIALGEAESLHILKHEREANDSVEPRYQMHRLVREVRRLDMPFETRRAQWVAVPQRIGDWFEARRQEFRELARFEAEVDHLDAWQLHASSLGLTREAVRLLWLRAYPSYHRGHYQQSHAIVKHALKVFEQAEVQDRVLHAHLLQDLGATFEYLDEYRNALEHVQQALAIRREVLGERHPDTAWSLASVGTCLGDLGDHRKALEYQQQALAIRREVLGAHHSSVARSLADIGGSFGHLGDQRKALEYAQQALAIRREVLGERHPDTALSLDQVGLSLGHLGDDRKALKYARHALVIRREVLSERHPYTLLSWRHVVQCLINLKQKVAALRTAEEGLKHAPADPELQRLRASLLGRPSGSKPTGNKRKNR